VGGRGGVWRGGGGGAGGSVDGGGGGGGLCGMLQAYVVEHVLTHETEPHLGLSIVLNQFIPGNLARIAIIQQKPENLEMKMILTIARSRKASFNAHPLFGNRYRPPSPACDPVRQLTLSG